jgi:hypothetical protein
MRPGRVLVVVGSILTALSLLGVAVGVWLIGSSLGSSIGDALRAPVLTTPVERSMTLEQGAYTVYTLGADASQAVAPGDVEVVSAGGRPLPVSPRIDETFTRGNQTFVSFAGFTVPSAGRYDVTVGGAPGVQVIVGRSVLASFRDAVPGVLVGVSSGLMLIVGLALLIIGLVRRSRSRRTPPGPWTPPTQLGQWPQPGPWGQPEPPGR